MKEALYYYSLDNNRVQCRLCPFHCVLNQGQTGICRVRTNIDGKLIAQSYGKICSYAFDPIEKKPLYHFYPGRKILSLGNVGCNLRCKFCQNANISQTSPEEYKWMHEASVDEIMELDEFFTGNLGVAYTYNEPITWYEYMLDIAKEIKASGGKNVMVTNGYIDSEPLSELMPVMDAFSVDLKGFSEAFYHDLTSSSLAPVKKTLEMIAKSGKHLEIVNLIIPEYNDDKAVFLSMIDWINKSLGSETVLHLSRYFPHYQLKSQDTPVETLMSLFDLAKEVLPYVYVGNVVGQKGRNTYCPQCGNLIVERCGYSSHIHGLTPSGECAVCKRKIPLII